MFTHHEELFTNLYHAVKGNLTMLGAVMTELVVVSDVELAMLVHFIYMEQKIPAIKVIRRITRLPLKPAKDIVDTMVKSKKAISCNIIRKYA